MRFWTMATVLDPWSLIHTREVPSSRPSSLSQPPKASNPGSFAPGKGSGPWRPNPPAAHQRLVRAAGEVVVAAEAGLPAPGGAGGVLVPPLDPQPPNNNKQAAHDKHSITHYVFPFLFNADRIAARIKRPIPLCPAAARARANSDGCSRSMNCALRFSQRSSSKGSFFCMLIHCIYQTPGVKFTLHPIFTGCVPMATRTQQLPRMRCATYG